MDEVIAQNSAKVRLQIAEVCNRYGRKSDEITIVAVTKGFPPTVVRNAVAVGFNQIGENRVQEAEPKIAVLGHIAAYHMVGHLQSNKVKKAVQLFDVIQSVDSLNLAEELNKSVKAMSRTIECYVQVNTSGEAQKFGVASGECLGLIEKIQKLPNIKLTGLMTIGPLTNDENSIRNAFSKCRALFIKGAALVGSDFQYLSMGMSDDFPLAIAEGSTMIRLGTAIFGPRLAQN